MDYDLSFIAQIVPDLASRSPFSLVSLSFWHVPIIYCFLTFWYHQIFQAYLILIPHCNVQFQNGPHMHVKNKIIQILRRNMGGWSYNQGVRKAQQKKWKSDINNSQKQQERMSHKTHEKMLTSCRTCRVKLPRIWNYIPNKMFGSTLLDRRWRNRQSDALL